MNQSIVLREVFFNGKLSNVLKKEEEKRSAQLWKMEWFYSTAAVQGSTLGFHVCHLYCDGMALSRLLSKELFEAVLG